jgi:hypothetical protein
MGRATEVTGHGQGVKQAGTRGSKMGFARPTHAALQFALLTHLSLSRVGRAGPMRSRLPALSPMRLAQSSGLIPHHVLRETVCRQLYPWSDSWNVVPDQKDG